MFHTDHEKQFQPIFPERIVLGFGFSVPRRVGFATRENQIGQVPRMWPFVFKSTRVQHHVVQYPPVNLKYRTFFIIFETLKTVYYRSKQRLCVIYEAKPVYFLFIRNFQFKTGGKKTS